MSPLTVERRYPTRPVQDEILRRCEKVMRAVCADFETLLVEFNGETDHVHLPMPYPPKISLPPPRRFGPQLPLQPHETEFHLHPCFRPALDATHATDLHPYGRHELDLRIRYGQQSPSRSNYDVGIGVGRDFYLLEELVRSCDRILRQVDRAVDLPAEPRSQVSRQVGRAMSDASQSLLKLRNNTGEVDAYGHVLAAADYFGTLAAQLLASGIDDGNGSGSVVHRIEDEARRLRRTVGGGYTPGGSNSA